MESLELLGEGVQNVHDFGAEDLGMSRCAHILIRVEDFRELGPDRPLELVFGQYLLCNVNSLLFSRGVFLVHEL